MSQTVSGWSTADVDVGDIQFAGVGHTRIDQRDGYAVSVSRVTGTKT